MMSMSCIKTFFDIARPVGVAARPPKAVSLYLDSIDWPISPIASTHSSTGITALTLARAICADELAIAAALADGDPASDG